MRWPVTISKRSRIISRSRNAYQNIETAPSSSAAVPRKMRCEWMRLSSQSSVRIQTAFSGVSTSSSFSTASTNVSSLFWKPT